MIDIELQIADTLQKFRESVLSWDVVVLLSVRLLELRNPSKTVVLTEENSINIVEPDGSKVQIFLHNLRSECERYPEERAEIIERYFRVLVAENDDADATADDIVALVRDSEYRAYVKAEDRDTVTQHLVGDLWIVYAIDQLESTSVLSVDVMRELGLLHSDLRKRAIANLGRLLSDLETIRIGEFHELTSESSVYLAGALLLDDIWDYAETLVEGDVIVALPARDTLLFTGASNRAGLSGLRQAVDSVFSDGDHLISRTLLRRIDGQWKLFL